MTGVVMAQVGAAGPYITLGVDRTITNIEVTPTNAAAGIRLQADGDIEERGAGGAYADQGDWIVPKQNGSAWEVRATVISGTLSSGTTGSWLALSADRTWQVDQGSVGTNEAVIDLEVRHAVMLEVKDIVRITLHAEVSS